MPPVEDVDRGWKKIEAELRKLSELEVVTGVQGSEEQQLVRVAAINEFGSKKWVVTSKQAYFMARRLMGIDPTAEPGRFWATFRTLRGKVMQVPERSYLRASIDANPEVIRTAMLRFFDKVAAGELEAPIAMAQFGAFTEALVKKWMRDFSDPPNAPLTIHVKKADNPLIDKGRLVNSIRFRVRPKGGS